MTAVQENLSQDEDLAFRLQQQEFALWRQQNPIINNIQAQREFLLQVAPQNRDGRFIPPNDEQIRNNMTESLIGEYRESVFYFFCLYGVAEIAATIYILYYTRNVTCQYPLKVWLAVFSARFFLIIPIEFKRIYSESEEDTHYWTNYMIWSDRLVTILFILGIMQLMALDTEKCDDDLILYCEIVLMVMLAFFLLPILILLTLCFCMPCAVLLMEFSSRLVEYRAGANEGEIAELGTKIYEKSDEEQACSICMVDFENEEELRVLPCDHYFHQECVDAWLRIKKVCPLCRHNITEAHNRQQPNVIEDNAIV